MKLENHNMKHLVFCWEYGAGYGHIAGFIPIAKYLKSAGVKVSWILKHLDHAHLIRENGFEDEWILQAPIAKNTNATKQQTVNYSQIMTFLGFSNEQACLNLVSSWRDSLQLLNADMIVADHAPAAIIASQTLNIKRCMIGTGFFSPPRVDKTPAFSLFNNVPENKIAELDNYLVKVANYTLTHFKQQPITKVAELFSVEEDFLCTFPELDHYTNRKNQEYWGARFSSSMGKKIDFTSDKFKIFVYIHSNMRDFEQLLTALNNIEAETILHVPKLNVERASLQFTNLTFSPEPIEMDHVLNQVDLAICNAGHGTVAAVLLAGKRLLLVPNQLEQRILTQRLIQQGLAATFYSSNRQVDFETTLTQMMLDSKIQANVQNFQNLYWGYDSKDQAKAIADCCLDILAE